MTRTTETCFCLLLFFFFFKRNICTCKFTAKLNHKGYLQIVTLLFRLPYVCLMIKCGSSRQRCVVPTQHVVYIQKRLHRFHVTKKKKKQLLQKSTVFFYSFHLYSQCIALCLEHPLHTLSLFSDGILQSKNVIANKLISSPLLTKWSVPNILNNFLFFCSPTKQNTLSKGKIHTECTAFNFWFATLYVHICI